MAHLFKHLIYVLFILALPFVAAGQRAPGSVYAISNNLDANTVVAYSRGVDGKLTLIGEFPTGGKGGVFNLGVPSDPLISQFAVILTSDRRFLLAVNAGSNTVSVFRVAGDFSLTLVSVQAVPGVGPLSIAQHGSLVYVASIDIDGKFTGPLDQVGLISGFKLLNTGRLEPIARSVRKLPARPSTIKFTPDGKFIVVSGFNAGSALLAKSTDASIILFKVFRNGLLSRRPVDTATSTLPGNPEGRNLPNVIGIESVRRRGVSYVIATEARILLPDGTLAPLDQIQTGSVSSWRIDDCGRLIPVSLDVLTGDSVTSGFITACWLTFSKDEDIFWVVSTTASGALSSFSFSAGRVTLINAEEVVNPSAAFIDACTSSDGKFLYQNEGDTGMVGAYSIADAGAGSGLTLIETVPGLPTTLSQGMACF